MSQKTNTIENCYISIDIEEDDQLKKIYQSLSQVLNRLGVAHEISPRPHVSIAYTLGVSNKVFFENILSEMSKKPLSFKAIGVVFISGENTDKDYIGLRLDQSGDFSFAKNYIADKCPIKLFKEGFISHISLFQVPKGFLAKDDFYLITRYLESAFSNLVLISHQINASSISAFNKAREKQLEFKIQKLQS